MRGRGVVAGAVLATVACVLPGCSGPGASHAVIDVSAPTARVAAIREGSDLGPDHIV